MAANSPIVCVCKGCGIRYVLGVNAVVVTMGDVFRELGRRGGGGYDVGHPPSAEPDTIALEAGQQSWPAGMAPPPASGPVSPEVVHARERGDSRKWTCDKCKTTQEYAWCSEHRRDAAPTWAFRHLATALLVVAALALLLLPVSWIVKAVGARNAERRLVRALERECTEHADLPLDARYLLALSPDARYFLAAKGTTVRLLDAVSGNEIRHFSGHTGAICSVAFSSDGHKALTSSEDRTIRLWDVASGTEIRRFPWIPGALSPILPALSPDGRMLFIPRGTMRQGEGRVVGSQTVSEPRDVTQPAGIWGTAQGKVIWSFPGDARDLHASKRVGFSPDGRMLLPERCYERGFAWDLASGTKTRLPGDRSGTVYAFSPNGESVLLARGFSAFVVCDTVSGKVIEEFEYQRGELVWARFSANGQVVATAATANPHESPDVVQVWDVAAGEEIGRVKFRGSLDRLVVWPDGKRVLSISGRGAWTEVHLWNTETGEEIR